MWPLLFCSIMGFAIIADRLWAFSWTYLNFRSFLKQLKHHLKSLDAYQRPHFLKNDFASATFIANIYYDYIDASYEKRSEALKREGMRHLEELGMRLKVLSIIAQIAPLLGLLGTVTGLVASFQKIEMVGVSCQPLDFAGGIWEALITTVVGLSIGIPCLFAYQYFQAKIDRRAHEMTETVSQLDEVFTHASIKENEMETSLLT